MYTPEERFFQKLAETGQKEFSTDMIKEAMHKVAEKDLEIQYQEYLKGEEARNKEEVQWRADENTIDRIERSLYEADAEPVSWAEATKGLEIPQREQSQDTEMER